MLTPNPSPDGLIARAEQLKLASARDDDWQDRMVDLMDDLTATVQQLQQEKADFHLAYRTDCDRISKAALIRAEAADTHREALTRQVAELTAERDRLRAACVLLADLSKHQRELLEGAAAELEQLFTPKALASHTGRT